MQNVIYSSDFFQSFPKITLKKGLEKLPSKNLIRSAVNTGSHSYAQKEWKPPNLMFTGGYLKFQKSNPKKAQKVTRESIESYHYITK